MVSVEVEEEAPSAGARVAARFLRALADGVPAQPPSPLTAWLTVGRDELTTEFRADLSDIAAGETRTLILLGGPGAGKSQLLITLEQLSRDGGFATTYFSQDLGSRLAFNRPDTTYQRTIETLRLPNDPTRSIDPLKALLDKWVAQALPHLNGTFRNWAVARRLADVGLLPAIDGGSLHRRTCLCLVGYLMASEQQNLEVQLTLLKALRGFYVYNRDLVAAVVSLSWWPGNIGYTPSRYDERFYLGQLGVLVWILRAVGYKGLVALFDEVTAIVDLRSNSRAKAYRVIDAIFFNHMSIKGFYTLFSYMPAFANRLRSDRWDVGDALIARWESLWEARQREVTPLNRTSGAQSAILELGRRLATLHGSAYAWDAWATVAPKLQSMAADAIARDLATRDVVQRVVRLLDETESQRLSSN